MTKAQNDRRRFAIAKARAVHPVSKAIVGSKWKTQTQYAKRLGVDQSTLSRYLAGLLETPVEVADRVFADFGLSDCVWSRPPIRTSSLPPLEWPKAG